MLGVCRANASQREVENSTREREEKWSASGWTGLGSACWSPQEERSGEVGTGVADTVMPPRGPSARSRGHLPTTFLHPNIFLSLSPAGFPGLQEHVWPVEKVSPRIGALLLQTRPSVNEGAGDGGSTSQLPWPLVGQSKVCSVCSSGGPQGERAQLPTAVSHSMTPHLLALLPYLSPLPSPSQHFLGSHPKETSRYSHILRF